VLFQEGQHVGFFTEEKLAGWAWRKTSLTGNMPCARISRMVDLLGSPCCSLTRSSFWLATHHERWNLPFGLLLLKKETDPSAAPPVS
jgi:hypothetical protein